MGAFQNQQHMHKPPDGQEVSGLSPHFAYTNAVKVEIQLQQFDVSSSVPEMSGESLEHFQTLR